MRIGILDFIGISFIILGIIISFLVYKLTFGTILLMLLGSAFLVWSLLNYLLGKNRVRYIRRIRKVFLVLFTIWFFSFLLIQGLMLTAVDPQKDAEVDYLLILGAGLRGEIPSLTLHTRLVTGLDYLKDHPKLKVIVSGGQGPGETITEAEAMKRFLESNGIPEERIIKEDKSTSTQENLMFTKKLLIKEEQSESFRLMIVTSDFHMFRSKYLARKNGIDPYGIPAETPFYLWIDYCVREYFAIIKSFVFD